ncbi:assembly of actin patch protein [Marasmius sp. AFHP31]|nr:assembly of actin patch protein [Marasmius sp. AFHP31]
MISWRYAAVWAFEYVKSRRGMYEKSIEHLLVVGRITGSVDATLAQVPNAAATPDSEILPGDIVWLKDAKLKGHKGLHTYTQGVGEGDEANQHVGQQTVESVSYRMEDLESGVVKVFRVLEA